jgi:membrane protein YdbS with pleckstrin-like domain
MSDGDGTTDADSAARPARADESADARERAESVEQTAESASTDRPNRTEEPDQRDAATATAAPDPEDVDVDELTGPERSLHPRVRYVWVLQAAISALVLGVMAGIPSFFVLDEPLVGPAVFLVFFLVGATLAVFRYRRWSYEVREDSLFLDRGVVTQTRTVVPYVRIQHVDASRGPVERAFGLATAVVYTAGSRGADVSIPGLTPERADDLQERLKRLAIAAEGEDAV